MGVPAALRCLEWCPLLAAAGTTDSKRDMTTAESDTSAVNTAATAAAGGRVFDHVCRLVPASGLQFIDAQIEATQLPVLRAWFTEDEIEGTAGVRRVLLPLSSEASADGTIWHPLTFKPLGPDETLSFTGLEALEPFLDTWVPVPFLRYLGRSDGGAARFDQGPTNWARVFVAKPTEGLRGADVIKAVFAFDTRLDTRSRADQQPYLAPNVDDALFASTFILADTPEELSDFLSQPWIDAWVDQACRSHVPTAGHADLEEAGFAPSDDRNGQFSLAHVARYLTFLKILKRAATPPQIRLVDSISKSLPVSAAGIDLVIDFGAAETTALLIPRAQSPDPDISLAARNGVPLRLRDLANPVVIHTGPIPTMVEFDNQTFGNAHLSRRSGRADAFAGTSLVRIGAEAQRLSLRVNATEGITGLSDIASGLDQTSPSDVFWRFSTPDGASGRTGPMVTGETLRHLSEVGDVTARTDGLIAGPAGEGGALPTMRPRFSQSSLVGFFIVELLLHAISEINCAAADGPFTQSGGQRHDIRHIERIIITSPIAMPTAERQALIERVNTAIDLVWRTQQWDQPGPITQPMKPQLAIGIGPDVGLQLVYLFTEVRDKFGGSFSDLVDCVRRRTGEPTARDNLRISSMELSRRAAGLTVVDYDVAHDGSVQANLVLADRTGSGGERVVDAIVASHILAAIEAELNGCGLGDAQQFMDDFLRNDAGSTAGNPLAQRLITKILRPAAASIFDTYATMPRRGAEGLRHYRLDNLVAMGGGRLEPIATQFEAFVAAAGAINFRLAGVRLSIGRRHIQRLVEVELWPMVNAITDAIQNSDSDILLMGGDLAQLPDLLDHVLSRAPVPAGRIVVRGKNDAGATGSPSSDGGARNHTHDAAVIGAYMASRNMLQTDGFSIVTSEITRALALDNRTAPNLAITTTGDRGSAATSTTSRGMERAIPIYGNGGGRQRQGAGPAFTDELSLSAISTICVESAP